MMALVRAPDGVKTHFEKPPAGPSVRILFAAVCGTDIQIARGERPDTAQILGHEAVGLTQDLRLVVFNPMAPADTARILGHDVDGVFRSRYPISETWPEMLVAIPATLPPPVAVLSEPASSILYGWEIADAVQSTSSVGVWGAGTIGLMHCIACSERGYHLQLFHHDNRRLEWARDALPEVFDNSRAPGSPELDLAILCTGRSGTASAMSAAISGLRDGGLLLCVGGVPQHYAPAMLGGVDIGAVRRRNSCGDRAPSGVASTTTPDGKQIFVTGHRGTSPRQILAGHSWLARNRRLVERLITHRVDPNEGAALINARCAHEQRDHNGREIVKVVIDFERHDRVEPDGSGRGRD